MTNQPLRQGGADPFEWVTIVVVVLVLLATASIIGGFVEAGNHTHAVIVQSEFGGSHHEQAKDWNYLFFGIGQAVALLVLAVVLSLLRAIAVDVRKLASR